MGALQGHAVPHMKGVPPAEGRGGAGVPWRSVSATVSLTGGRPNGLICCGYCGVVTAVWLLQRGYGSVATATRLRQRGFCGLVTAVWLLQRRYWGVVTAAYTQFHNFFIKYIWKLINYWRLALNKYPAIGLGDKPTVSYTNQSLVMFIFHVIVWLIRQQNFVRIT